MGATTVAPRRLSPDQGGLGRTGRNLPTAAGVVGGLEELVGAQNEARPVEVRCQLVQFNVRMGRHRGQKRAPFGIPKGIVLPATPSGWRHSITTVDGGLLCGQPPEVPDEADAEQAKESAAAMLRELGREFHGAALEVAWEAAQPSGSWIGHIQQRPEPQHEEADHLTSRH